MADKDVIINALNESKIVPLLQAILNELKAMKKQEFDYWEAWRKAKANE